MWGFGSEQRHFFFMPYKKPSCRLQLHSNESSTETALRSPIDESVVSNKFFNSPFVFTWFMPTHASCSNKTSNNKRTFTIMIISFLHKWVWEIAVPAFGKTMFHRKRFLERQGISSSAISQSAVIQDSVFIRSPFGFKAHKLYVNSTSLMHTDR